MLVALPFDALLQGWAPCLVRHTGWAILERRLPGYQAQEITFRFEQETTFEGGGSVLSQTGGDSVQIEQHLAHQRIAHPALRPGDRNESLTRRNRADLMHRVCGVSNGVTGWQLHRKRTTGEIA